MMEQTSKIIIFCSMIFMLPFFAHAAPESLNVADNEIQHGQSVTVTGVNFGTKISGQAAPVWADDLATGTAGHQVTEDFPFWTKKNQGAEITSAPIADFPRGAIAHSINQQLTSGLNSSETGVKTSQIWNANPLGFALTKKIFVSYWTYLDWGTLWVQNGGTNNHAPSDYLQIKEVDISTGFTATGGATPNPYPWEYVHYIYALDSLPYSKTYHAPYIPGGTVLDIKDHTGTNVRDVAFALNEPGWYHTQMQIYQGDPGISNASRVIYNSDFNLEQAYFKNSANNELLVPAGSVGYDYIKFGWYRHYNNQGTSEMYHNNIYIDNSWARVEIGDQPTYDACTHREIQIPSNWNDTDITFTTNKGSFADGNAYLYITDENGVQNAVGYPITFSSAQEAMAPASPSGLNVM